MFTWRIYNFKGVKIFEQFPPIWIKFSDSDKKKKVT